MLKFFFFSPNVVNISVWWAVPREGSQECSAVFAVFSHGFDMKTKTTKKGYHRGIKGMGI